MVRSMQTGTYISKRLALSPNKPNQASTCAPSPQSTIGCDQNGFLAYAALGANRAPSLHRNKHYLQTDQSKITYDTRLPSGVSKLISKYMVCSMQTVQLSCIKIYTISKQTEPSFYLSLFT